MTIIVFLVDTSGSMNQRTYSGMSLLDTAKGAVETFMKVFPSQIGLRSISRSSESDVWHSLLQFIQIRSRDHASRMDRYMLLTFEDPPANVKVSFAQLLAAQVRSGSAETHPRPTH